MSNPTNQSPHPSDEWLAVYLNGLGTAQERQEIEKHLIECEECRTIVADFGKVDPDDEPEKS